MIALYSVVHVHFLLGINDNLADVDPDLYTIFYDQSKFIDHSTPIYENSQIIVSVPLKGEANIFEGIFDNMSYALICLSIIIVGVFLAYMSKVDLVGSLFSVFKITMRQDLDAVFERSNYGVKGFLIIQMLALSCIGMMYTSIVISILSVQKNTQKIDSLFDLVTKYKDKRIHINSYLLANIMKDQYYEDLKDRLDVWDFGPSYVETLTNVYNSLRKQTHVSINIESNVGFHYSTVLPLWLKCALPQPELYFSKQNLGSYKSGYLYRKGFQWKEEFDLVQ